MIDNQAVRSGLGHKPLSTFFWVFVFKIRPDSLRSFIPSPCARQRGQLPYGPALCWRLGAKVSPAPQKLGFGIIFSPTKLPTLCVCVN